MEADESPKFAILMKKSFYISITFLFILFLTMILGLADNRKSETQVISSSHQIGLKASNSVQQQDLLFMVSIAENDVDVDKTFFDLPFTLFEKDAFSGGLKSNSNMMMSAVSEMAHHYHLPRYLLFHNLKVRIFN